MPASGAAAATVKLVGFGDSLMAGYQLAPDEGLPQQLQAKLRDAGQDIEIANAGVSGDTTADGLARLDWSVPDGTDGVILELGANDALRGLSPEQTEKNLEAMITRLKERRIAIYLVGMLAPPNMGADYEKRFNEIYPRLAKSHDLPLYPFVLDGVVTHAALQLSDGMHPNAKGVAVMVERMLPSLDKFLGTISKESN
ncbi:acyl-CoA thioesterase-1 [Rhizobium halophytocola]|uniref:Acyl-CoA thioesterase-1 n=1 Tax=Rhizobium halophytocola TaxID=735519 RepID=A0ABS4E2Y2_9HYPH|nr:acyl-CoA thioesterase-1 [Rhizobium halophytocola]